MSLAVEGRVNSDFFWTTLPPLYVVTVTLETDGFFGAALRVLVLRAGFAVVVLEALAVAGMWCWRVYSSIIHMKKPLKRGL